MQIRLVDLHDHPLYNVYPRWTPPQAYHNRYEWRSADSYMAAIANPHRAVAAPNFCDMDRFVELKGLFGGTTTTLGISQPRDTDISCIAGLAPMKPKKRSRESCAFTSRSSVCRCAS